MKKRNTRKLDRNNVNEYCYGSELLKSYHDQYSPEYITKPETEEEKEKRRNSTISTVRNNVGKYLKFIKQRLPQGTNFDVQFICSDQFQQSIDEFIEQVVILPNEDTKFNWFNYPIAFFKWIKDDKGKDLLDGHILSRNLESVIKKMEIAKSEKRIIKNLMKANGGGGDDKKKIIKKRKGIAITNRKNKNKNNNNNDENKERTKKIKVNPVIKQNENNNTPNMFVLNNLVEDISCAKSNQQISTPTIVEKNPKKEIENLKLKNETIRKNNIILVKKNEEFKQQLGLFMEKSRSISDELNNLREEGKILKQKSPTPSEVNKNGLEEQNKILSEKNFRINESEKYFKEENRILREKNEKLQENNNDSTNIINGLKSELHEIKMNDLVKNLDKEGNTKLQEENKKLKADNETLYKQNEHNKEQNMCNYQWGMSLKKKNQELDEKLKKSTPKETQDLNEKIRKLSSDIQSLSKKNVELNDNNKLLDSKNKEVIGSREIHMNTCENLKKKIIIKNEKIRQSFLDSQQLELQISVERINFQNEIVSLKSESERRGNNYSLLRDENENLKLWNQSCEKSIEECKNENESLKNEIDIKTKEILQVKIENETCKEENERLVKEKGDDLLKINDLEKNVVEFSNYINTIHINQQQQQLQLQQQQQQLQLQQQQQYYTFAQMNGYMQTGSDPQKGYPYVQSNGQFYCYVPQQQQQQQQQNKNAN